MGVRIARVLREHRAQLALCFVEAPQEHQAVGEIDPEPGIAGRTDDGFGKPFERRRLVAQLAEHAAQDVLHEGVAVVVPDRLFECGIAAHGHAGEIVELRKLGPGRGVAGFQGRHRSEGTNRVGAIAQFDGDQADQEVGFRDIRLCAQNAPADFAGGCGPPGLEVAKALAQGVADPGHRLRPSAHSRSFRL